MGSSLKEGLRRAQPDCNQHRHLPANHPDLTSEAHPNTMGTLKQTYL